MITLLFQNVHTRAAGGWMRVELQRKGELPIKHYLRDVIGLMGVRSARALKRLMPNGSYSRIRMTYVPRDGDIVALTPKDW